MNSQAMVDAAGNRLRKLACTMRRGVGRPATRTSGYNPASAAAPWPLLAQTGQKGTTEWLRETAGSGVYHDYAADLLTTFVLQSLA
jgi:hypothetical protein